MLNTVESKKMARKHRHHNGHQNGNHNGQQNGTMPKTTTSTHGNGHNSGHHSGAPQTTTNMHHDGYYSGTAQTSTNMHYDVHYSGTPKTTTNTHKTTNTHRHAKMDSALGSDPHPPTQQHQPHHQQQQQAGKSTRSMRSGLLHKQREIEEVDEEDASPGSDQSDTTITAGAENTRAQETDSQSPSDDLRPPVAPHKHNHISPKLKQLTRSEAVFEDSASPPLDPLQSTASTCSTDSSSSGIGTNTVTSGSGSSYHGRLEKDGSQSSEAGTSSSLSRDSSVDTPYKDSTGIDLEDFIRKTLNKTPKDRSMLIKLEVDLIKFIREPKHHYLKFPPMSSYDRMLVHRIAAFFGLDHNVDQTGKCVIVNKTQNTRIPDFSFQENIVPNGNELKPKMVLKRGGGSFDESQTRNLQKPSLDATRSARSLEERQQLYNEARSRIFTPGDEQMEGQPTGYTQEEASVTGIVQKLGCPNSFGDRENHAWSSMESSGYGTDCSSKQRIYMPMPKANSFGGTGSFMLNHMKSSMRAVSLSKADSMSMGGPGGPVSGCNPMMRPLVMSSPTYPGGQSDTSSSSPVTQGPAAGGPQGSMSAPGQKVYWVASDPSNIPPGSVVINPQTGQPYVNQDGSTYKFTPGQPLPQPGPGYASSPQPQLAMVPQVDWANQRSQDSQGSQPDLTQQLSVMGITPQSSLDSGCTTDSSTTAIPPAAAQQPLIINPNMHQQATTAAFQPQAIANQPQTGYYPGGPTIPGAQPLRYMCPVNLNIPNGTGGANTPQGYIPTPGIIMDGGQQGQQVYPNQPYIQGQQYIQGYQVNPMFPVNSSQGQMQGQIAGGQSSEGTAAYGYSIGSPVDGPGGYTYPVQYNQTFAPNQSHMYYTLPTPNQPQGYTYTGQQGTTYQSNTPPSQNSTNPNVQLNSVAGAVPATAAAANGSAPPNLNVNLNNINNAAAGGMNSNIPQQAAQPQPTAGMVVSQGGQPQMAPSGATPFMYTSHPSTHTAPQCPPTFRVAAPASAVTAASQQVVPFPGGPVMGQGPPHHVSYQNTVYRQNMQHLPMQIHPSSQQHQPPQPSTGGATKANHQPSQHSHVTVSAKGVSYEQAGAQQPSGAENGMGENGDVATPARSVSDGPPGGVYRPPQTNPADGMRYPTQSSQYRPGAAPVQQQQFSQPQSVTKSPTLVPKPQRVKKSRNRDGNARSSSTIAPSASSGNTVTSSNVLEVCDLPRKLRRHELDNLLHELRLAGAHLQYRSGEPETRNDVGPSTTIAAANHNQTISQVPAGPVAPRRVFAVFPDADTANQILQTHSSSSYALRLSDSIGQLHT